MARFFFFLIPLLYCTPFPRAPQKKPVFVTASFLAKNRMYIEDLTRDEVRIFENGKQREIAYFAGREVPVSFGLLFDRKILPEPFEDPRREGNQIPSSMAAGNVAFQILDQALNSQVGWLGIYEKELQVSMDFTADSGRIKDAIQMIRGRRTSEESYLYSALFSSLQKLGRRNEKRRILILFLKTLDTDTGDKLKPLKNLLAASNVELFIASFASKNARETTGLPGPQSEASLRELGIMTAGGTYFSHTEGIESIGRRIANQIRAFYTLGFESESNAEQPASLKIECTRPGVKISFHPIVPSLQ